MKFKFLVIVLGFGLLNIALPNVVRAQTANRVFVTSTSYSGELGVISGADAKCQVRADSAGLGGVWKSWISINNQSAPKNIFPQSQNPYERLDGTVIANNWVDLTDGSLLAPINITELGTVKNDNVWTNISIDGGNLGTSNTGSHCYEWGWAGWSWIYGNIGNSSQTNTSWTAGGSRRCTDGSSLYCFELTDVTVPSAPQNLSISSGPNTGQIILNWQPSISDGGAPVSSYRIYRRIDSGNEVLIAVTSKDILNFIDSNLTGHTYNYRVLASNIMGDGLKSASVNTLSLPPDLPTELKASSANQVNYLSWSPPVFGSVAGYKLYRSTTSGSGYGFPIITLDANVLNYTDSNLTNGTTYYYKVTSFNNVGESGFSNEVNSMPLEAFRVFVTSTGYNGNLGGIAGADAKCQARADTAGIGGFTWRAWISDGKSSPLTNFSRSTIPYRLLNGTVIANNWVDLTDGSLLAPINITELVTTMRGNVVFTNTFASGAIGNGNDCRGWGTASWTAASGYAHTGNTGYSNSYWTQWPYYGYCSGWNGAARLYCFEDEPAPPSEPTNPRITKDIQKIILDWAPPSFLGLPSKINFYKIYRTTNPNEQGSLIKTVDGSILSYTDTDILINTDKETYYYRISAVNDTGESILSAEVNITISFYSSANRIFITSNSYNGNMGGLNGADVKCQDSAEAASLGGSWKAWLSDGATSASSRITHSNRPYSLVDNSTLIANNWADLVDGSLDAPIMQTEFGNIRPGALEVFTNTRSDGSIYSTGDQGNCADWTSSSDWYNSPANGVDFWGYFAPRVGRSDNSDFWTSWRDGYRCGGGRPLYCIENFAPGNLSAKENRIKASIDLSWKPVSGATGYKIYRSTTSNGQGSTPFATVGNILGYSDSNIQRDINFYYKVKAITSFGDSEFSDEVNARLPITAPLAPDLNVAVGNQKIVLSWTTPLSDGGSSITRYKIYRGISSGSELYITFVDENTLSYVDNLKNFDSRKYYKVSAVNGEGEGSLSNEINAIPLTDPNVVWKPNAKVTLNINIRPDSVGEYRTSGSYYNVASGSLCTGGYWTYADICGWSSNGVRSLDCISVNGEPPWCARNYTTEKFVSVPTDKTYDLLRASSPAVEIATRVPISQTSFIDEGLIPGTTYTYTVRTPSIYSRQGINDPSLPPLAAPTETSFQVTIPGIDLNVTKAGSGTGSVTGLGIDCGSDCSQSYQLDQAVVLTALPDAGGTFTGWSGACSGIGTCNLAMDVAKNVTATFEKKFDLNVIKSGTGSGLVTGPGINCGLDCVELFNAGTSVILSASPFAGSSFTGWSGPCGGVGNCNVVMNDVKFVTATFDIPVQLNVIKSGTGSGTVSSKPAGIDCGLDCSEEYNLGTIVVLTALPDVGSTFTGWSGTCSGTGSCNLNMNSGKSVTAVFSKKEFKPAGGGLKEIKTEETLLQKVRERLRLRLQ